MAGSISLYSSGSQMAAGVLGGVFQQDGNLTHSYVKYDKDTKSFVSNGPAIQIGSTGSTAVSARFKLFDREEAQSNRATYQAIQDKLAAGKDGKTNPEIANAFGWNFALSKMMGRKITDGAVVSFLDQQLSKKTVQSQKPQVQNTKAAETKKSSTSILGRLFGNWGFSSSVKQVRTKVTTAGAAWNEASGDAGKTKSATTAASKSKKVASKTTEELKPAFKSLAERIRANGGTPFDYQFFGGFDNFKKNTTVQNALSDDEKQIAETLNQHAQKNTQFLEKLNNCFSGESSKENDDPWGPSSYFNSVANELQGLYEETQKGKSIFSLLSKTEIPN